MPRQEGPVTPRCPDRKTSGNTVHCGGLELVASQRANSVFPDPGGPIIETSWPPAAAISSARLASSRPRSPPSEGDRMARVADVGLDVDEIRIDAEDRRRANAGKHLVIT